MKEKIYVQKILLATLLHNSENWNKILKVGQQRNG